MWRKITRGAGRNCERATRWFLPKMGGLCAKMFCPAFCRGALATFFAFGRTTILVVCTGRWCHPGCATFLRQLARTSRTVRMRVEAIFYGAGSPWKLVLSPTDGGGSRAGPPQHKAALSRSSRQDQNTRAGHENSDTHNVCVCARFPGFNPLLRLRYALFCGCSVLARPIGSAGVVQW